MKIGVVTWFKYNNYGTKLQALALQIFLKKKGFSPELLNFELPDSANKKNEFSFYNLFGRILKKIIRLTNYKNINQKENNMSNIISNNCDISRFIHNENDYINLCNSYDYLIFGSDQIWNPNWFHSFYYADYDSIKTKRIAYAPSIGVKSIPDILQPKYKKALSRFISIGMREKNGCNLISNLINKRVDEVLDPVFLLSKDEWRKYESNSLNINHPYILCYMLTDNKKYWKAIKKYSKKIKKELVIIPVGGYSYISSKNVVDNCGIGDFIKLFDNCDEVITDSFHGTVFSLIFNKNFSVLERHNPSLSSSENDRIINILRLMGLEKRKVSYNSSYIPILGKIDYKKVNSIIEKNVKLSKNYLDKALR